MNLIQLIMHMWHHMLNTTTNNNIIMYTILKNNTPVINTDNMETAIRFVQSLESGLNRHTTHSPYTIVKSTDAPAAAAQVDACIRKAELFVTQQVA